MEKNIKDHQPTPEERFRDSLRDVGVILEKLAGYCHSPEEAHGIVTEALQNDGQLRLLMALVMGK